MASTTAPQLGRTVALRDLPTTLPHGDYDLLVRLQRDHEAFRDCAKSIDAAAALSAPEKLAAVHDLVRLVVQHSMAEEMVLYPLARAALGPGSTATDMAAHSDLRRELSALSWCGPWDPTLDAKLARAWATLSGHMFEEEQVLLPALARAVPRERLAAAGRLFVAAKTAAPTRPHVAAPMTPPLNVLAAVLAAPLDWAADMWRFGGAPPM